MSRAASDICTRLSLGGLLRDLSATMMQSAGGNLEASAGHAESWIVRMPALDQRIGKVGGAGEVVSYTPEQQAHGRNPFACAGSRRYDRLALTSQCGGQVFCKYGRDSMRFIHAAILGPMALRTSRSGFLFSILRVRAMSG